MCWSRRVPNPISVTSKHWADQGLYYSDCGWWQLTQQEAASTLSNLSNPYSVKKRHTNEFSSVSENSLQWNLNGKCTLLAHRDFLVVWPNRVHLQTSLLGLQYQPLWAVIVLQQVLHFLREVVVAGVGGAENDEGCFAALDMLQDWSFLLNIFSCSWPQSAD